MMKKVMKTLIIYCIGILFPTILFSQQYTILNPIEYGEMHSPQDIEKLNEGVFAWVEKSSCNPVDKNIKVFYIFDCSYRYILSLDDFKNGLLFDNVFIKYYKGEEDEEATKYVGTVTLIGDKDNHLIGKGNNSGFFCASDFDDMFLRDEQFMVDHIDKLGIKMLFTISTYKPRPFTFAWAEDNKYYVFLASAEEIKVMSIDEFFDCCWDKYFDE